MCALALAFLVHVPAVPHGSVAWCGREEAQLAPSGNIPRGWRTSCDLLETLLPSLSSCPSSRSRRGESPEIVDAGGPVGCSSMRPSAISIEGCASLARYVGCTGATRANARVAGATRTILSASSASVVSVLSKSPSPLSISDADSLTPSLPLKEEPQLSRAREPHGVR